MNTNSKGNSLFDKWNQFALKIIPFMASGIKDGNIKCFYNVYLRYKKLT